MEETHQITTDESVVVMEPLTVQASIESADTQTETTEQQGETVGELTATETVEPAQTPPSPVAEGGTATTAPTSAEAMAGGQDDKEVAMSVFDVKEKIIERVRDLNESEREQIFRDTLKTLSPRGVSARRAKRQANLDTILAHLRQHGYIANNEVEHLCEVTNSTAWVYLSELKKKGLIIQLGRRGQKVRYRLTESIS